MSKIFEHFIVIRIFTFRFFVRISRPNMASKAKGKTQEQVIAGFQEIRQQQRNIAGKISELNVDLKEHELV